MGPDGASALVKFRSKFQNTGFRSLSETLHKVVKGKGKVKLSLCLIKHYAMKAYEGVDVQIHIFLTSALDGGEWSASRPGSFTPGERAPATHLIGSWVDPKAGLGDVGKRKFLTLPGLELRPLGRPARSQSLYGLYYHRKTRIKLRENII
jgi:hypothetical protein